ncbi:MAG: efflux RND transporter periplasmic adaptor subunit [Planctomycetales bacterium]|nr:efflux RND transporter periplasmic adaptor subunit [Planctomycetales bacterium]
MSDAPPSRLPRTLGIVVLLVIVGGASWFASQGLPWRFASFGEDPVASAGDEHDHAHEETQSSSVALTPRGLENVGYEPFTVHPTDYRRYLAIPALVVEKPGQSQVHITAPLTGVVTRIYVAPGEASEPGEPLFDLRLTYEELVSAQQKFLETTAQLDVVQRELSRLEQLGEGVVAGKRILEQRYEQQRLTATLHAAEQAMLLHGLSTDQIARVQATGELFRDITIRAPAAEETEDHAGCQLYTVQTLNVAKGEHVEMGRELARLVDPCELLIEAFAFEDDAQQIRSAAAANASLTARRLDDSSSDARLEGLRVLYVAGSIDPDSRAFKVYVRLPNKIALDKTTDDGKRYVEWEFKPGQRMQLQLPVETWRNQLALPLSAIVEEGAEAYAYRQNGDNFEQVAVRILDRDRDAIVVANDGALYPGDVIAGKGAFQMHLAFKTQSGPALDPHAGHNH